MVVRGVIGPYFYEEEKGCTVTLNPELYVKTLDYFSVTELQNIPGFNKRTLFQQDRTTSHTTNMFVKFFPVN